MRNPDSETFSFHMISRPLRIVFIVVALFLCVAPNRAVSADRALLWELQSPSGTVWLLGSMHLMTPGSYPLPDSVEKAYAASPIIVFETDMDVMNTPETQQKTMRLGLYPEGDSIRNHISAETYAGFGNRATALGLPMNRFDRLRPWLAGVTLSAIELKKLGFSPEHGVDQHYFDRAKKDGRKRLYLETGDFQLSLFAGLVGTDEDALLRQMLAELETLEADAFIMMNAWKAGDEERLDRLIRRSFENHPEIFRRLMTDRNRNWIPSIEGLAKGRENVLVIVGAGHLLGPDSVIDLLGKKGYKIERK